MSKEIGQLPSGAPAQSADMVPIQRGPSTNFRLSVADIVALASGGVSSFITRTGAITALSTDYSAFYDTLGAAATAAAASISKTLMTTKGDLILEVFHL